MACLAWNDDVICPAAAVWQDPGQAEGHVHCGILTLLGGPGPGTGHPGGLQVRASWAGQYEECMK